MNFYKLNDFTKGWFIGDFMPSIIKTKDYEIGIKQYNEGDHEERHVHKISTEITVIITGEFLMDSKLVKAGDIIEIPPGESTDFQCLKSGSNVIIKTPSVIGDKYIIK